jgi:transposase
VRQADIDGGDVAGMSTADREKMKTLEQENKELRRANEILKSASAFFAAELDRPQK